MHLEMGLPCCGSWLCWFVAVLSSLFFPACSVYVHPCRYFGLIVVWSLSPDWGFGLPLGTCSAITAGFFSFLLLGKKWGAIDTLFPNCYFTERTQGWGQRGFPATKRNLWIPCLLILQVLCGEPGASFAKPYRDHLGWWPKGLSHGKCTWEFVPKAWPQPDTVSLWNLGVIQTTCGCQDISMRPGHPCASCPTVYGTPWVTISARIPQGLPWNHL